MTEIAVLVVMSMIFPVLLFFLCLKIFKKPFLNILIYLLVLFVSVVKNIFWFHIKNGYDFNFYERISQFFKNDSIMILPFMWLPSLIGFVAVNAIYFLMSKKKKNIK